MSNPNTRGKKQNPATQFAPSQTEVESLPSLPLGWRKAFPACPAIYFAILDDKILYIGRTKCLAKRWIGHHREAELQKMGEVRIAWVQVSDVRLLPAIEKAFIRFFKPTLNHQLVKVRKKVGKRGNPQNFKNPQKRFAAQSLAIRVNPELDEYVRSLPNKNEWLRKAVAEAYERDMQQGESA